MAAGNFIVLNIAKKKLADGTFDLDTHTFKAALGGSGQSLDATFAGSSTDARYADLTAEVTGTGYTAGGVTLTSVTWTRTTGTIAWTSAAPAWTTATFTAKYLVIYDSTNTNKDILGIMELESGSTVSPSAGTLTVNPNASGWFTLA